MEYLVSLLIVRHRFTQWWSCG